MNLIKRFFTFSNKLYNLSAAKSNMKDGRKSPQISPSVIFLSLILMLLFKKHSLLKLDQFMRTDAAKRFFGRNKRVALSDSTISRSLSTYFLTPLRSYLRSIYMKVTELPSFSRGLEVISIPRDRYIIKTLKDSLPSL